jgi:hypothetical protein
MIKLRQLICEIIAERMTYSDLMRASDPKRADRAKRIPARSLVVKSLNDQEAWKFSYKTPKEENTTGLRHQGFIHFFKEGLTAGENAMKIDCSVDCSCPDYKYRFSFANKAADAGDNGPTSLNKGLSYPSSINAGPGLCKHLISLKEYLRTKIEGKPEPPTPEQPLPSTKPLAVPASPPPETVPPEEPEPVQPEVPQDPTQTPDPDKEKELQADPEQPNTDPTQTPQEPEEEPGQGLNPVEPENEKEKEKLKESPDKMKISKILDDICAKQRIFIV